MGTLQTAILSDREKAAIRLHIYGSCEDWHLLYQIAGGTDGNTTKTTNQYVSKWKLSSKVRTEIEAIRTQKALEDEARKRRIIAEYETEKEKGEGKGESLRPEREIKKGLDFYDPVNQKKLLNDLINTAKDPDEKLDALKIITATQRDDRQAAKEGRQVRAYLPLNCSDCPLYLKAKAQKPTKG